MSLLTLSLKIGSAVLAVGTAVAVPIVITRNSSSQTKTGIGFDYKANCHIIPTEKNTQEKLLICNNRNYYLLNELQNDPLTKVKSLKVQKGGNSLVIVLEGGAEDKNKTLAVTNEKWKKFKDDFEMTGEENCHLGTIDPEGMSMICKNYGGTPIKVDSLKK